MKHVDAFVCGLLLCLVVVASATPVAVHSVVRSGEQTEPNTFLVLWTVSLLCVSVGVWKTLRATEDNINLSYFIASMSFIIAAAAYWVVIMMTFPSSTNILVPVTVAFVAAVMLMINVGVDAGYGKTMRNMPGSTVLFWGGVIVYVASAVYALVLFLE